MRKNLLYSIVLVLVNTLYPVVVFPYISRVLSVESIGIYNYYNLLFGYLVILSNFGISLYASREIGKLADKPKERDERVLKFLTLNALNALIVIVLVVLPMYFLSEGPSNDYLLLFCIMLIANSISIEWYFVATENQSFVFYRNILVKLASLIVIYSLVRNEGDLSNYILIVLIGLLLNAVVNLFYFFKQISCSIRFSIPIYDLRPLISIFLIEIAFRFYGMADVAFAEKWLTNLQLGYLTFALSIYNILSSFLKIIATTLLPRASYYIENNEQDRFISLLRNTITMIFLIGIPGCIVMIFGSEYVVYLLGGDKYAHSVGLLSSFSMLLLISALINIIIFQYLYPLGRTKVVLIGLSISILLNVVCNYIFIQRFQEYSVVLCSTISNLFVLIYFSINMRSELKKLLSNDIPKYFFVGAVMGLLIYLFENVFKFDLNPFNIFGFLLGFLAYVGGLILLGDRFISGILQRALKK